MQSLGTTKSLRIRSRRECTAPVRHIRYAFVSIVDASCFYG